MLPEWLLLGLAGAAVVSVAVTAVFVAGARLFPTAHRPAICGGEQRRRAEIREYLTAIGEQFAEDHPVGGQPVAFYLPARDVAITFDARAYFRIEGSPNRAVLVEHEMPGVHLGSRLPFETPPVELDGEAQTDAASAAFAILGVPASASADEVKRAYREQVKRVHPDHGGDREAFERLREAYAAAKQRAS